MSWRGQRRLKREADARQRLRLIVLLGVNTGGAVLRQHRRNFHTEEAYCKERT